MAGGGKKKQQQQQKAADPAPATAKPGKGKQKGKVADEPAAAQTEKPNPNKLLFGNWTGKTPVTLLNEFVQKSKWQRPDYNMHGGPSKGFSCTIRLTKIEKNQPITVVFKPEPTERGPAHLPSALEARHMAATYALHRLRSNTNMHRMLPPMHREYWTDLDKVKKTDGEKGSWKYSDDPFTVKVLREKERDEQQERREKERERRERAERQGLSEELLKPFARRRWDDMAEVQMSQTNRDLAESVIRTWSEAWSLGKAQPVKPTPTASKDSSIEKSLVLSGFRAAHVKEALQYTHSKHEALDWLCVHVPEDDLPEQFMQRAYRSSLVLVSNNDNDDQQRLARQLAGKRLARSGFPTTICMQTLSSIASVDLAAMESIAATELYHKLCGQPPMELALEKSEETYESIEYEFEGIEAIYPGERRVKQPSEFQVSVAVRPQPRKLCPEDTRLEFWFPPGIRYPEQFPAITVSSDSLPSYLKLHIAKKLNGLVSHDAMPVIYEAVSVAEAQIEEWLANPPALVGLMHGIIDGGSATASSNVSDADDVQAVIKKKRHVKRHKKTAKDTEHLSKMFAALKLNPAYCKMQTVRESLPAWSFRAKITDLVESHRCTVVSGATGCGKSTQVPQFLLDQALQTGKPINIICTQPRRISAIGVASRVAEERAEDISENSGTVGYAVRGESRQNSNTRLLFCTTGVLLRMFTDDPDLSGVTHIVCDEVHERSVDSDLLLVLLKQCLERNRHLRVVLMSATAECELFGGYFGNRTPIVEIPGRTFPVDDVYVEDFIRSHHDPSTGQDRTRYENMQRKAAETPDEKAAKEAQKWLNHADHYVKHGLDSGKASWMVGWDSKFGLAHSATQIDYSLVLAIVQHIHKTSDPTKAVLVFMPGVQEISKTIDALGALPNTTLLPLHAGLGPAEQKRVFRRPPSGSRKIVVSTNVAETSITIDDIGFVVDSGRVREIQYDAESRIARLATVFCSQAASTQRRGRAGRNQRGTCYKLFSRPTQQRVMAEYTKPEIQRTPLEQVCLQAKTLGHADSQKFLDCAISPPDRLAVVAAEKLLVAVGASTQVNGALTALGRYLGSIPADLRLAKMLVYGAVFGILDQMLVIVSLMASDKPLFNAPHEKRALAREKRMAFATGHSDWLADVAAFERCSKEGRRACADNFVSFTTMRDVRSNIRMLRDAIRDTGLIEAAEAATPRSDAETQMLVKAIVFAGLSTNTVRVRLPQQKYQEMIAGTISVEHEARQ
ncbi:helicase, partial [Linderina pennispora]